MQIRLVKHVITYNLTPKIQSLILSIGLSIRPLWHMWNIKMLLIFVSLFTIEFQIFYIKDKGCSIKENERMVRFSFSDIYKPILAIIPWFVANSLKMWIAWDMVALNENRKEREKPTKKKRNLIISKLQEEKPNAFNLVANISKVFLL